MTSAALTRPQRIALAVLRTLIGWHFAYEGVYKLVLPGWSRDGRPLAAFSAAGYLNAASGPLAPAIHRLAQPPLLGWVDLVVPLGLVAIGVSLILGVFARAGAWAAVAFLSVVYLSSVPTAGLHAPGSEGAYLFVNRNLIELAAVLVLIAFRARPEPVAHDAGGRQPPADPGDGAAASRNVA